MKLLALILSFTFVCACSEDPPNTDLEDAGTDGSPTTDTQSSSTDETGGETDVNAVCERVMGYSLDLTVPCLLSKTPDRDFGCRCQEPECSGLSAVGCFYSPDEDALVITPSLLGEPDPLEALGFTICDGRLGDTIFPEDIPLCE